MTPLLRARSGAPLSPFPISSSRAARAQLPRDNDRAPDYTYSHRDALSFRRYTAWSKGNSLSHYVDCGESAVSIVRIGLAETKNFSEGWEAIFGKKKKKPEAKKPATVSKSKKKRTTKKKS
jgi:hypothetical protein